MQRRTRIRRPRSLALVAAIILVGTLALPAPVRARGPVNCADLGNTVDFTLRGNLEITEHGSKCVITGAVTRNVTVSDDSTICAPPPEGMGQQEEELTAVNVIGGEIKGNIRSSGGYSAMIWLRHGSIVDGNVLNGAAGNLGFLDIEGGYHPGSTVHGNVLLKSGNLFAAS